MNLYAKLQEREAQGKPLRVGMIGAGNSEPCTSHRCRKRQACILPVSPTSRRRMRRASLERVGWKPEHYAAASLDAALKERRTHVSEDWRALVAHPAVEIVVEATGNPIVAVEHALAASETASTW